MQPLKVDLAYIGGMVDGEGSIMLVHQKWHTKLRGISYTHQPHVSISNQDQDVLEWIRVVIGFGYVRLKSNKVWQYEVRHINAIRFLGLLRPWLRIKVIQADLVMEFHKIRGRRIGDRALYTDQRISKLYCEHLRRLHYKYNISSGRFKPCNLPYTPPSERVLNDAKPHRSVQRVRIMHVPKNSQFFTQKDEEDLFFLEEKLLDQP